MIDPMIGPAARAALDELVNRDDPSILGLVLSGSAARGMATERSDVDVYVVRDDDVERDTLRSPAIDEIRWTLADLEQVDRYGSGGWYFRWSERGRFDPASPGRNGRSERRRELAREPFGVVEVDGASRMLRAGITGR